VADRAERDGACSRGHRGLVGEGRHEATPPRRVEVVHVRAQDGEGPRWPGPPHDERGWPSIGAQAGTAELGAPGGIAGRDRWSGWGRPLPWTAAPGGLPLAHLQADSRAGSLGPGRVEAGGGDQGRPAGQPSNREQPGTTAPRAPARRLVQDEAHRLAHVEALVHRVPGPAAGPASPRVRRLGPSSNRGAAFWMAMPA